MEQGKNKKLPTCKPLSSQTKLSKAKLIFSLNSPRHRQQTRVKIHLLKSHQSLQNSPKEPFLSYVEPASHHLSSFRPTDRSHRRTSYCLQSIAIVSSYKPKMSPTTSSLICHRKMETKSRSTIIAAELSTTTITAINHRNSTNPLKSWRSTDMGNQHQSPLLGTSSPEPPKSPLHCCCNRVHPACYCHPHSQVVSRSMTRSMA